MAGNIVHFEINAKDANRAKRFYSSLFGWKFKDSEIPGIEYYVIDGANPGGAINPMQQDAGPVVYFDTDDIDVAVQYQRTSAAGGAVAASRRAPGTGPPDTAGSPAGR